MRIKQIGLANPDRPLRFGMRVRVTGEGSFYEGCPGTLIAAQPYEPLYLLQLDWAEGHDAWIDGDLLTPMAEDDPEYAPPEPEAESDVEFEGE